MIASFFLNIYVLYPISPFKILILFNFASVSHVHIHFAVQLQLQFDRLFGVSDFNKWNERNFFLLDKNNFATKFYRK